MFYPTHLTVFRVTPVCFRKDTKKNRGLHVALAVLQYLYYKHRKLTVSRKHFRF